MPGFVGDVALVNMQFHLDWPVDRLRLRDAVNGTQDAGNPFLASYEPLVRDVAVSLRHACAERPLPDGGAVFPRWSLGTATATGWTTVTYADARKLVPHINVRDPQCGLRVTSLRVFGSGATVVIGRWPGDMTDVFATLRTRLRGMRGDVQPDSFKRQRTLPACWPAPQQEGTPRQAVVRAKLTFGFTVIFPPPLGRQPALGVRRVHGEEGRYHQCHKDHGGAWFNAECLCELRAHHVDDADAHDAKHHSQLHPSG